MSKTTLKKLLSQLTKEQMIDVILEMYEARKDAREYLEYFIDPNETAMAEKAKAITTKEFFPQRGRAKGRTSVCRRAIKEFSVLHPSRALIADVKFHLVESIIKYATIIRWWLKESQENTLRTSLRDLLEYCFTNDLLDCNYHRIRAIIDTLESTRSPKARSTVEIYVDFLNVNNLIDRFKSTPKT